MGENLVLGENTIIIGPLGFIVKNKKSYGCYFFSHISSVLIDSEMDEYVLKIYRSTETNSVSRFG
jgi:hypothetical protein